MKNFLKFTINPIDEIKTIILIIPYLIMIYFLPAFLADYLSYSIGIIIFFFGLTSVIRVRMTAKKNAEETGKIFSEKKKIIISGIISVISAIVWIELFTYNSWLFWSKIDFILVFIWMINTFFYSYILTFLKEI